MFQAGLKNNKVYEFPALLILIAVSIFLFTFRLDNEYVFTDEVIYIKTGTNALQHKDYSEGQEIPILGKYLAGMAASSHSEDIFLLRFPYAMLGVLSSIVVYFIAKRQFGHWYGLAGMFLYLSAPLIYKSTRMVMLESPLFLFWLIFHYFFIKYLDHKKIIFALIAGSSLGIALAFKLPTLVLLPFAGLVFLVKHFTEKSKIRFSEITHMAGLYLISIGVFASVYIPAYITGGIETIKGIINQVSHEYFQWGASAEKRHLIANKVYEISPWWTYWYYFKSNYSLPHLTLALWSLMIGITHSIKSKNFWGIYWILCFIFNLAFVQALSIKNGERYAAEFELPLIFIMIYAIYHIINWTHKTLKIKKEILALVIFVPIFIYKIIFTLNIHPTKYNALYLYLQKETSDFTALGDGNEIYVYEMSGRTYDWHFGGHQFITNSQTEENLNPPTPVYKYVAIDKEAKKRDPALSRNKLFKYLKNNEGLYQKIEDFEGFDLYIRND